MRDSLTRYMPAPPENMDAESRLADNELVYYASSLMDLGLEEWTKVESALLRAMDALQAAHLSCRRHFKKIFISQQGELQTDWLVSPLGMRMVIMHTDTGNPVLARLKVQLLSSKT